MESSKSSRLEKDASYTRRRRSRSLSDDSEEERRRRRRKQERDHGDRDTGSSKRREDNERRTHEDGMKLERGGERWRQGEDSRRPHDRNSTSRRSRSPERFRRRQEDYTSRRRTHADRSPAHRSSKDADMRPSREGSATQITHKKSGPLPSQAASFQAKSDPNSALVVVDEKEPIEKEKPNFAPSGLLAAASNSVTQADGTSIALKYHEPAEARKPPAKDEWKLFVFKGSEIVETIELSTRSCWLVGREVAVVDMPAEHPSVSKQHAVIQFRYIEKKNEYGDKVGRVRPYIIDLDSANGTKLNKEDVPSQRYLELRDKDMIQFGHSTREYVLMLPPKS